MLVRFGISADTYEFMIDGQVLRHGQVHPFSLVHTGGTTAEVAVPSVTSGGVTYRPTLIYSLPKSPIFRAILPNFAVGCRWRNTKVDEAGMPRGHSPDQTSSRASEAANKRELEIRDKFFEILANQFDIDIDGICAEADLVGDLGADSLDVIEIVMSCEEEFDVKFDDDELLRGRVRTVGDGVAALMELVPSGWAGQPRESHEGKSGRETKDTAESAKSKTATECFATLGISSSSPPWEVVQRAFAELAKKYHPDRYASVEMPEDMKDMAARRFREIKNAYDFLRTQYRSH